MEDGRQNTNAIVSVLDGEEIVYDVAIDDRNVDHMIVNGIKVAVLGYPVKGMVHPFWGSNLVLDELEKHCPGGGLVYVDGRNFKVKDGLVSSIF